LLGDATDGALSNSLETTQLPYLSGGKTISAQQNVDGLQVWDKPGLSGYLVCLVHLVSRI
jgi:hypothetical protein